MIIINTIYNCVDAFCRGGSKNGCHIDRNIFCNRVSSCEINSDSTFTLMYVCHVRAFPSLFDVQNTTKTKKRACSIFTVIPVGTK